jgi:ankyrin repeat protein
VTDAVQERLAHYDIGPRDATGRQLDESIRVFQAQHSLPADGKLSDDVMRELSYLAVDLDEAARRGDAMLVDRLLSRGADPNKVHESGWTPLLGAVGAGNLDIVRRLVSAGADVNRAGADGMTPILLAALAGDRGTAQLLWELGADALAAGPGGVSAVQVAERTGDAELARLLAKPPSMPRDAVAHSAASGDMLALQAALAAGGSVNAADPEGWTGLMYAASRGDKAAVEKLLAAGADPNKTDRAGLGALHLAAAAGQSEIVRVLLEGGADAARRDAGGATAAMLAVAAGHREIANSIRSRVGPNLEMGLGLSAAERGGIERLLNALGYGAGALSDPQRQAVRRFQESRQLAATGYVDEITLHELGRAVPPA